MNPLDLDKGSLEAANAVVWVRGPEVLDLLAKLEKFLSGLTDEGGYHCALGGSVLHKGHSNKDLDVIVYPHDFQKRFGLQTEDVWSAITGYFAPTACGKVNKSKYRDDKDVRWLTTQDGKRIDFFFLS